MEWNRIFGLYQGIAQSRHINPNMTLGEFKGIFWWEYAHRLLGRLIGVVFVVPLAWFAWRGKIDRPLGWKLGAIFVLGGLQGAVGYMKAHGMHSAFLVSDPWHNARIKRMAADLGIRGYASATWTSAATSEETRFTGYARETLAYLYYRVFGR